MSIGQSIRTFLLSKSAITDIIGAKAHQSRAPQVSDAPFIVYFRRTAEDERELAPAVGDDAFRESFDVECVSDDLIEAEALAAEVRAAMNNYGGSFGSGTVQGVFVEDQDDQYQQRLQYQDGVLHTAALYLELNGYTES